MLCKIKYFVSIASTCSYVIFCTVVNNSLLFLSQTRDNSVFTVLPASAVIDPYSSLDITITADLDDALK